MKFVHEDPEFAVLLTQTADTTGIGRALVEKDYWITHALWALHECGLQIWFKGGTSLSKGFGIIERFSEDLDLMVEGGADVGLPPVGNWTSTRSGPVGARRAFFEALTDVFKIPSIIVERDLGRADKYARGGDYTGRYPGVFIGDLPTSMAPSVRFEIGRARVVPYVVRPITSFVHEQMIKLGVIDEFVDNRPRAVRCVHPLVTLLEKLDALARRYSRDPVDADRFVRHYEDAARIVREIPRLPPIGLSAHQLATNMVEDGDLTAMPMPDDPSLSLADPARRAVVERAYESIAPMFWGARLTLDETCRILRDWTSTFRN